MGIHSSFEADVRGGLGNAPARRNVLERDARSTARRPGAEYVDGQRSRCHWLMPSSAHRALGARDETGDPSGFERKKAACAFMRSAVSAPPRNARVAFSYGNHQCYLRKFDNFEATSMNPRKAFLPRLGGSQKNRGKEQHAPPKLNAPKLDARSRTVRSAPLRRTPSPASQVRFHPRRSWRAASPAPSGRDSAFFFLLVVKVVFWPRTSLGV